MPKKSSVIKPWKKATPKKSRHTRLTAKSKAAAKRQAEKAGRGYPNLVDNMNAAKKQRARGRKDDVMKARTKDPKGGLTAAGRKELARKEGAHLRPGVKKPISDMTPEEMKRKGSWAVRFYGREKLPPLQKEGKPTRFALSAAAWGEPVPTTEAAARKIAAKGRKLLERYERTKKPRRSQD